jgi:hypothetical protein
MCLFPIKSLLLFHVGNENCASMWSFLVTTMVENDTEINGDDSNSLSEHENIHHNPRVIFFFFGDSLVYNQVPELHISVSYNYNWNGHCLLNYCTMFY